MKRKEVAFISASALISLLSLLYMNYYETILYYNKTTQYSWIFDKVYEYIAIPFFYFFATSFISFSIFELLNIGIAKSIRKIIKYILSLTLIFYIILIFTETFPYFNFISFYSIIFSVLGCLFALASHKKDDTYTV